MQDNVNWSLKAIFLNFNSWVWQCIEEFLDRRIEKFEVYGFNFKSALQIGWKGKIFAVRLYAYSWDRFLICNSETAGVYILWIKKLCGKARHAKLIFCCPRTECVYVCMHSSGEKIDESKVFFNFSNSCNCMNWLSAVTIYYKYSGRYF